MIRFCLLLITALFSGQIMAMDVVFGPDIGIHGMKVGASYIQGVIMSPKKKGMPKHADIHLETDVHALPGNPQGFPATAWIPGLKIHFVLTKDGSNWRDEGDYLPMVAQGGPHYGMNIKLDGPGHYRLTNYYQPPSDHGMFLLSEAQKGVYPWWQPFVRHYQFDYLGTGKHGGY